jgi:hypothetical protein
MTGGSERLSTLLAVDAFDERWEEQYHVASFVHNWCSTVGAADLAGQVVGDILVRGIVPAEIVVAVREIDIAFVEDGSMLEGCLRLLAGYARCSWSESYSMESLTRRAMAVLASQWLLSAQLVLDLPAMTAPLPLYIKVLVVSMNSVWLTMLPCINVSVGRVARLILVSFWVNRAVGLVITLV